MPNENDITNDTDTANQTNSTDNEQPSTAPVDATSSDNSSDNNNTNDNVNTELEDFKQYAKIDFEDDDNLIQIFLAASKNYITKATGQNYDDTKELHHLLKNLLTLHFYENRQSVNASSINEVPFTIQNLLTFIQSTSDSTYELQEKEVVPTDVIQEVVADPEYFGLSKVTVQAVNLQNLTISQNGEYEAGEGYSGIGKIIVNVLPNLEDKFITENGIYIPSEGKDGFNEVTVNVQPEPLVLEPTTVSSTASEQVINPPSGVAGFSKVNVNPVELEDKTITENGVYTSETKVGFGEVTVDVQNLDIQKLFTGIPDALDELLEEYTQGRTTYPNVSSLYIKKITIPNSVTTLPEITNNTPLEEIVVDNKPNLNIDSMARCFYNLQNLRKITFKNLNNKLIFNTTYSAMGLFSKNPKLEEFEFPNVNTLSVNISSSQGFFRNCTSLKSVRFNNVDEGNTLTNICYGCTSLTSFSIPDNITVLSSAPSYNPDGGCFNGCTSLTNIDFNNVKSLGPYSFLNSGLTSANSDKITTIGNNAFSGCSGLTSVNFPAATTIANRAFEGCRNLSSVNLPMVTSIGNWSFYGCYNLTSVTLGSNLTSINASAFPSCPNLTEINIYAPKSQVTTAANAPWGAPSTCQVNWLGGE